MLVILYGLVRVWVHVGFVGLDLVTSRPFGLAVVEL